MPAKKTVDGAYIPEPFRPQISITDSSTGISEKDIRTLAVRQSKPHLAEIDHTQLKSSKEKTSVQREIASLIVETVKAAASGQIGDGYQLSEHKEVFFSTARTKAQENEEMSQAEAIRACLRVAPGAPILLSEIDLVNAAVRAAREQSRKPSYSVEDLIREAIAMFAQTLISKHIASTNSKGPGPDNLPGSGDDQYMKALNELRALKADPDAWRAARYRSDQITVSILARKANTNDIQIRNFLRRRGVTDVFDPKTAKAEAES